MSAKIGMVNTAPANSERVSEGEDGSSSWDTLKNIPFNGGGLQSDESETQNYLVPIDDNGAVVVPPSNLEVVSPEANSLMVVDEAPLAVSQEQISEAPAVVSEQAMDVIVVGQDSALESAERGGVPAVVSEQMTNLATIDTPPESTPATELQRPLTAVSLDRTHDAKRRARELAEQRLNEKLNNSGILKKWIMGNPGREYFLRKYEKTAMQDITNKQAGGESSLTDAEWRSTSNATMERMVTAEQHKDEMAYAGLMHEGETSAVNVEATKKANEVISKYARGELSADEFNNDIEEVRKILRAENGGVYEDNFFELANTAKVRFEHGEGVESIMQGFQVLSAEVRDSTRTEVHRTAIDKVIDKWNSAKQRVGVLSLIPEEVVASAAGIGLWAAQSGTKNLARFIPVLGTTLVGGGIAAVREGSRMQADRQQRLNEIAMGQANLGHNKLDEQVAETAYDMKSSNELTSAISEAMKGNNPEDVMRAVLEAEAYVSRSDSNRVDYIGYSSPDKVADERWALDLAIAQAKASLPVEKYQEYKNAEDSVYAERMNFLEQDENAKDAVFKKLRHKRMLKMGVASGLMAGVMAVAGQEIRAAFDDNTYGLVDRIKDQMGGNGGAAEHGKTLLAGALGFDTGTNTNTEEFLGLTEAQVQEMRVGEGDVVTSYTETIESGGGVASGSVRDVAEQFHSNISYVDFGANGTLPSDMNELAAGLNNEGTGYVTWMSDGGSMTWGGEDISFTNAVENNQIAAYVTLSSDTRDLPIRIAGNVLPNGQVEFIPEPGSPAAAAFRDGKFVGDLITIVREGDEIDGVRQVVSLAAEGGSDTVGGVIDYVEPSTVTEETFYNVVKEVPGEPIDSSLADMMPFGAVGGRMRNLSYEEKDVNVGQRTEAVLRPVENNVVRPVESVARPVDEQMSGVERITGPIEEFGQITRSEVEQISGPVAEERSGAVPERMNNAGGETSEGVNSAGGEMLSGINNASESVPGGLSFTNAEAAIEAYDRNPAVSEDFAKADWEGMSDDTRAEYERLFRIAVNNPRILNRYWSDWGAEDHRPRRISRDRQALFAYWYRNIRDNGEMTGIQGGNEQAA